MNKADTEDAVYLDKIRDELPKDTEDTVFLDSIRVCLDYVTDGSK